MSRVICIVVITFVSSVYLRGALRTIAAAILLRCVSLALSVFLVFLVFVVGAVAVILVIVFLDLFILKLKDFK